MGSSLHNILSKINLPFLTLPFNIVMVLIFTTLIPAQKEAIIVTSTIQSLEEPELDWINTLKGVIISMGQVYALNSIVPSIIICMAVGIYSPLLLLASLIGAAGGCLLPITYLPRSNHSLIYTGLLGYNSLLSMASMSCIFLPHSMFSFTIGIFNTVLTAVLQKLLTIAMVSSPRVV